MNKFESETIQKKIKNAEIVSFDIFDTLVFRLVRKPSDIFDIVNVLHNSRCARADKVYNFRSERIQAEEIARLKSGADEVSVLDIYENLNGYSQEQKEQLLEEELFCERKLIVPNFEMVKYFKLALKLGKVVLIVSDIYLDKEFIEEVLHQCGLSGYHNLYLSSESRDTKSSGKLFKKIIDEENIKPEKWLHIGNDLKSDILNARKCGIKTFLYISGYSAKSYFKPEDYVFLKLADRFSTKDFYIKYRKSKSDKGVLYANAYKFGYQIFGILILGYVKWLHRKFEQNKLKYAYFFSREGYFIKKAYDFYYNNRDDKNVKTEYLRVSRKALYLPALTSGLLLDDYRLFYQIEGKKVGEYLFSLGITESTAEKFTKKHSIRNNDSAEKLSAFEDELKSLINDANIHRLEETEGYLKQFNIPDRIAIVDVGWSGGMQIAFEQILNDVRRKNGLNTPASCFGFFLGQDKDMQKFMIKDGEENPFHLHNEGWLFDFDEINERHKVLFSGNEIFELIFDPKEGTTLGYEKSYGGNFIPIQKQLEFSESYKIIELIQQGALDYISDIRKLNLDCLSLSVDAAFTNFSDFLCNPSNLYVEMFGDISAYDSESKGEVKLAEKVKSFNPKVLFKEFDKSYWKVGYLKRNFPDMHINYAKLYYYIRELITNSN